MMHQAATQDIGRSESPPAPAPDWQALRAQFPAAAKFVYLDIARKAILPVWVDAAIRAWLKVFLQRFFGFSQFKRSAMPNGPKVAAGGSLSPRGDWRAPSDGNARIWLEEVEREVPEA